MSEYKALMDQAVAALQEVMRVDAQRIAASINHVHSFGAILDPTAYRNGMSNLDDQQVIAQAILAAQKVVLKSDRLTAMLSLADAVQGKDPWPCIGSGLEHGR
jgi:hypothetical protein